MASVQGANIIFKVGTRAQYEALAVKQPNIFYLVLNEEGPASFYLGDILLSNEELDAAVSALQDSVAKIEPLLDMGEKIVTDEEGNPIQAKDENGNPLTNEDGTPLYETEPMTVTDYVESIVGEVPVDEDGESQTVVEYIDGLLNGLGDPDAIDTLKDVIDWINTITDENPDNPLAGAAIDIAKLIKIYNQLKDAGDNLSDEEKANAGTPNIYINEEGELIQVGAATPFDFTWQPIDSLAEDESQDDVVNEGF